MFKTDLTVKRNIKQNHSWIVQEPLIWEDENYYIKVKKGFDFDFASIPAPFRVFLPKQGKRYDRASCLHDALYASKWLPKKECDRLFYKAMLEDGVPAYRAKYMHTAVKWFGKSAYNSDEDLDLYKKLVKVGIKG